MQTITIDVMGGDNGVKPASLAALDFCKNNKEYKVILVGDKREILKHISLNKQIEIIDSKNIATGKYSRKSTNSMSDAINLIKENKAQAMISAGSSGILVAASTLKLKRIKGVSRPAFMVIIPSAVENKEFILLDVGANLETKSEYLVQWAKLGIIFSKNVLGVKNPRTAIINIGIEESKGFDFQQEAFRELKKDKQNNFKGFVEPREFLNDFADVVVVDGYGGNILIKTIEGTGKALLNTIKINVMKKFIWKLGAFLSKGALKKVKNTFDYRSIGSAWVIGVDGLIMKAHGASDQKAFTSALYKAKLAIDNNTLEQFKKAVT